jgi:hypothetical protein
MRINIADCDMDEPSRSDVADELEAMRPETRSEFIPYEPDRKRVENTYLT